MSRPLTELRLQGVVEIDARRMETLYAGVAGVYLNESTSMVAGQGVVLSGRPGHSPPTATLRIAYIGWLNTHWPVAGNEAGVNVASMVSSTPTTIMSG